MQRWRASAKQTTGWRRPIGCLILQVSSNKSPIDYMVCFREKTCKHKASHGAWPPCILVTLTDTHCQKQCMRLMSSLKFSWPFAFPHSCSSAAATSSATLSNNNLRIDCTTALSPKSTTTHRMPYLAGIFQQISHKSQGSSADRDLQI